ncbi:uncharacterized protein PGTG_09508 [Puccinia graminis f. sp. tritici CRL 75-36-700-3]|uniref:WW domain-containing protein n=1 Tax=Puccinia graminis f. sp. tritici (strain CRL 75-36-700-3 / race SCCL) TaxID=418459 RepID=E3KHM0_PUCGT|nr:uncharacterized protein PGTG_09508 [Puccinia graminis f. sp. tritici CRL 75-36-700-3]EFP83795.1 hypothetical protein PGTG_09508 [Puccinia graminis f. sp. tritici CRL 75-36-700-3]
MDPEDVLDFGEDDDGLDVISLGASDHDGRPVSNRSSSTTVESTTRSVRQPRPSSPTSNRHLRTTSHTQPNGSDRRRHGSVHRAANPPQAPLRDRNHQSALHPADRSAPHPDRRLLVQEASRHAEQSSVTAPPRERPPSDRPRPGERASYMPPERLHAVSASSRTSDPTTSKTDSRRPVASLSTRITTDHRDADQKPPNPLSSSKPDAEREKFEEAKDVEKPVEPSITSTELPEGWISRISKGSKKTYYVNALTRTSQWNRPTEPASGKPTKPAPKVASKAEVNQPVQEATESRTHPSRSNLSKIDSMDSSVDSPLLTRCQQERGPNIQASQSLDNQALNLRPSSTTVSHDRHQLATPQEPSRYYDTDKSTMDDHHRQSNLIGSGTAHASDSDIDGRSIHQEKLQPDPSESCVDHRIHPDRRQEIASAIHPDRRQEIASAIHPDRRQDIASTVHPDRRQEIASAMHPDRRAEIASPKPHRGRISAPEGSKATIIGSFHRDLPPHSDSNNRNSSRHAVTTRYPHDSGSHRSAEIPRPRSISPVPRRVASRRSGRRDHREHIQLSGANGIPTAPGRCFPDPIAPLQTHEMYIDPEVSRFGHPLAIPPKMTEPPDYRDVSYRRGPEQPYDRDTSSQDRRASSWTRHEAAPISPIHPLPRHSLALRPRSPSPPPRRMPPLMHVPRAPLQPDLYPPERTRSPPTSHRLLLEERSIRVPEPSESFRRNPAPRYDAYRPSPSFPSETKGPRPLDPRRGDAYYPRDQDPHRSEPSLLDIRRSQVAQHLPLLPEPPRIRSGMSQPDLYRPPPRPVHPPRLSPRRPEPNNYYPIIDLDEISNKNDPPPGPSAVRISQVPPPATYPVKETPQPPLKQPSDRSQDLNKIKLVSDIQRKPQANSTRELPIDDSKQPLTDDAAHQLLTDDAVHTPPDYPIQTPPRNARKLLVDDASKIHISDPSKTVMDTANVPAMATLGIPKHNDRSRNGRRGRSIEPDDLSEKDANASSDIIEIPPPPLTPVDSQTSGQPVSLAKRLGPVADCSGQSDKFSPPAKRSRRNPVDLTEACDVSNDFADNSKALPPSTEEKSSSKQNLPSSSHNSSEKIAVQSPVAERPAKVDQKPETDHSVHINQDRGISLRGRAGRKSEHTGVPEQHRSQVEKKGPSDPIPAGTGSLRDRIQDLAFSPVPPVQSRVPSQQPSPGPGPQRSQATHHHEVHHGGARPNQDPPVVRHISERISGFRVPLGHSSPSHGSHRARYAPRQSDSGWSGRKARYS